MGAAAGLFSQSLTAGQSLSPFDSTTGASGSNGSSSSSDGNSATISANDFLELLVTEMQNQDPTDATDPNEYINQLVNVNSLEQLIDINQTLTGAFDPSSTGTTGDAASPPSAAPASGSSPVAATQSPSASGPSALAARPAPGSSAPGQPTPLHVTGALPTQTPHGVRRAPGNLSVPAASPAAERVAHSLDGRPRAKPLGGKLSSFEQIAPNNRP